MKTLVASIKAWFAALFTSLKAGVLGYVWERTAAAWRAVFDALPTWVTGNGVVTWLWGWLKYLLGGLWRSFWKVWKTPMVYPVLAVVAVLCFVTGHGMGRKDYRALASAYTMTYNQNVMLRAKIASLTAASVVTTVPPSKAPAAKVVAKPEKPARPQRRKSVTPKKESDPFSF